MGGGSSPKVILPAPTEVKKDLIGLEETPLIQVGKTAKSSTGSILVLKVSYQLDILQEVCTFKSC